MIALNPAFWDGDASGFSAREALTFDESQIKERQAKNTIRVIGILIFVPMITNMTAKSLTIGSASLKYSTLWLKNHFEVRTQRSRAYSANKSTTR